MAELLPLNIQLQNFRTFYEYESECFTTLWMIQSIFRDNDLCKVLSATGLSEVEFVTQKPVISVIRDTNIDTEIDSFISRAGNGTTITLPTSPTEMNRPCAIFICLNPNGTHGNIRLSDEDKKILQLTEHLIKGKNNFIYLIQGRRHHKYYDAKDLVCLSKKVSSFYGGEKNSTNIFRKMFFIEENQALFRIGLCLVDSLIPYLNQISKEYIRFPTTVDRIKDEINRQLEIKVRKMNNNTFKMKDVKRQVSIITEKYKGLFQFHEPESKLVVKDANFRSEVMHQNQSKIKLSMKETRTNTYNDDNKTSASSSQKSTGTCLLHTAYVDINDIQYQIYASQIKEIARKVQKEIYEINESILFHEVKTVALRHEKVKGFGCTEDSLCINLKANIKSDENEVREYLANFFDYDKGKLNGKYELCVQFKERKITFFSNLQQGSKINKYSDSTEDKKFGSVGIFLHDENGSYYFTTCAHVIGKDALAFNPEDNSRIGENVFAIASGEYPPNPFFDFSVVRIKPERNLTCTFGLRAKDGDFTNFRVFRGDILEIRKRLMYVWGASDPQMRSGKCISCGDEDGYVCFHVDTEHFARPGDSGSIICVGDQIETCYAAFVLVGRNEGTGEYIAYKVSDAIDVIKHYSLGIKHHFYPRFNVQISTYPPDRPKTLKRKTMES